MPEQSHHKGDAEAQAPQRSDGTEEPSDRLRQLSTPPASGATEAALAYAQRYWAHLGVDHNGQILWSQSVKSIDPGVAAPHAYAGSGATATVTSVACARCNQAPWQVKTRTDLAAYVSSGVVATACGRCDQRYSDDVKRESRAEVTDQRLARAERLAAAQRDAHRRQQERALQQRMEAAWTAKQRQWVLLHHALDFRDIADLNNFVGAQRAPLPVEASALACLRYAPSTTPIPPLSTWTDRLAPDGMTADLIPQWSHHHLLKTHPDSGLDAFVWEPGIEEALTIVGEDLELLPEPEAPRYYPMRVQLFCPLGASMGTGARRLDEVLAARLDPSALTFTRRGELLELVTELIAGEILYYFDDQLRAHYLPEVPDNHRARLREAAMRIGSTRALGQGYCLAWQAVRAAAAAAKRNPYAPAASMTTHGVNRFEELAQRAATDATYEIKTFSAASGIVLSALTLTVFQGLLNANPHTTSRIQLDHDLPAGLPDVIDVRSPSSVFGYEGPVESSDEQDDDESLVFFSSEVLRLVARPAQPYDPVVVRDRLIMLAQAEADPQVGSLVDRLVEVFDAVAAVAPEASYAQVTAVCAAANLITGVVRRHGGMQESATVVPAQDFFGAEISDVIPWDWARLGSGMP